MLSKLVHIGGVGSRLDAEQHSPPRRADQRPIWSTQWESVNEGRSPKDREAEVTITPSKVSVGNSYSRKDLATVFGEPNIATSREGWYMREGNDYVPFFVTLDKTKADPKVAYHDFFEDGFFHWESQNQIAISNPRIVKVIEGQVIPMLFVREVAKIKNETQPFIYAGRLTNPIVDRTTSNPVKFVFEHADLDGSEGEPLRSLIEWKRADARRATVSSEVQRGH